MDIALKALVATRFSSPADQIKTAWLAEVIGDDGLAAYLNGAPLDAIVTATKATYKTTGGSMPAARTQGTGVAQQADQIEALCDAITEPVWDVFASKGYSQAVALGRRMQARTKAVGDVIDQALERVRAAATEAARTSGDQAVAAMLDQVAATLAPAVPGRATVTDSGANSVPAAKSASDPLTALIKGAYQWDGR